MSTRTSNKKLTRSEAQAFAGGRRSGGFTLYCHSPECLRLVGLLVDGSQKRELA